MRGFWLAVHLLAMMLWLGGMFFTLACLRPHAHRLEPAVKLPLMRAVLGSFFSAVTVALLLLWASGTALLFSAPRASWSVWSMVALAAVMTAIFSIIRLRWFPILVRGVESAAWPEGGRAMEAIRKLVLVNLALGILVVLIAAWGPYL